MRPVFHGLLPWLLTASWLPAALVGLNANLDREHQAILENRRQAFRSLVDPYRPIPKAVVVNERPDYLRDPDAWVTGVTATVFWVGEEATQNNPTPNVQSAWDPNWQDNYGGYDDPKDRDGHFPRAFQPGLNPFYVALPYNDLMAGGEHRREAPLVVPDFWRTYRGPGQSVLKGRWVAIKYRGKTAYAQWEDVGPFETDHWQYVFGKERPRPNRNGAAGIDLSPAVRDYLGIKGGRAQVDWRFLPEAEVRDGPWGLWVEELPLPFAP